MRCGGLWDRIAATMTRSPNGPVDLQKLTSAINEVLETTGKPALSAWSDEYVLDDNPLAFESLDLEQLSIILAEHFGRDPYSAGTRPRTLGDLRRFFEQGS